MMLYFDNNVPIMFFNMTHYNKIEIKTLVITSYKVNDQWTVSDLWNCIIIKLGYSKSFAQNEGHYVEHCHLVSTSMG